MQNRAITTLAETQNLVSLQKNTMHNNAEITPDEALKRLITGNKRFVEGNPIHPHADTVRRHEVTGGQSPFAAVLTCSDSRGPPEIIFDQGIGDIFVIRVAGNIVDAAVMGSIVYAVKHLRCPLVTVLGHESCGAVNASLGSDEELIHEPTAIIKLVEILRRNIPNALTINANKDDKIATAIRENAGAVVKQIKEETAIAANIAEGKTIVRHAYYSLRTGEVTWC